MSEKLIDDRYLGDGVYASFDGYNIWLDTRGQSERDQIALEPAVLEQFDQYRRDIHTAIEAAQTDARTDALADPFPPEGA